MASETKADIEGVQSPEKNGRIEDSYGRIVTSSSLIGGSQVVGLVLGLFRVKLAAVLIGAEGVGLSALLQGIMTVGSTLCGLGLQQSGAREVAAAYAEDNRQQLSRTVHLIRRLAWCTGVAGLVLTVCFAEAISQFTFGNSEHRWEVALLGIAVLLGNLATSEAAAIQGTRQIGKLASIGIWSGVWGTIATLGCYFFFGMNGVAPALAAVAAVTWALTRLASRSIALESTRLTWGETKAQTRHLLQLGLALAVNGILVSGVAYLTRFLVNEYHGLAGVGLFSAAFSLSGMFVGFVLSAMSADFYPALTAQANDFQKMGKLINQQTEVAMLLAFPGLLGTLFLSPFVLTLFYSSEFAAAEELLRWFIVGCFGRILSWPLGYSMLAQGNARLFLLVETCFNALHLGLIWVGLTLFDISGVAIAFASAHLIYVLGMLLVTRKTIGFSWSPSIWLQLSWMVLVGGIGFLAMSLPFPVLTASIGCLITAVIGLLCLRQLTGLVGPDHPISRRLRQLPGLPRVLQNTIVATPRKMRVFHGLVNYGTQAGILARALRTLGCEAISVTNPDAFGRLTDQQLRSGGNPFQKIIRHLWNYGFKLHCFIRYEVFHFYYGTSLLPRQWDLPLYRLFGKKVILEYLGNDIQGYEQSIQRYRWTNVMFMMSPEEGRAADRRIQQRLAFESRYADRTLVCAPMYSEFAPNSSVLPLAIDLSELKPVPYPDFNGTFQLLHAPTDRNFKGTSFIIKAVEQLKSQGYPIELTIAENIPHAELLKKYGECHLFIDQILGGWYGTAAIEAMACGRPVICSLRSCYFQYIDYGPEIPVLDADPDTILNVLREILNGGISELQELGHRSRRFVELTHDSQKVAANLLKLYESVIGSQYKTGENGRKTTHFTTSTGHQHN